MKQYVFVVVAGLSWLGDSSIVAAAAPAWCGNAKLDANSSDLRSVSSRDPGQAISEVALKARAEWAGGVGGNTQLLQLVEANDSGALFHSRKLAEGCEARTAEALATAVSGIPAKAFTAMHDVRDDPYAGFAAAAGPLLANTPAVNLAATAFVECNRGTATADFLGEYLQRVPGVRGPRNAALGAVMGETFKFDDPDAKKLQYPPFDSRPYKRSGGAISSAGGVVKSVKPEGDALAVTLEKTSIMQEDCVQSHRTHRITRLKPDGTLEYESICDKTATVKHDTTWSNFKVNPAHARWLKPGVQFSSVQGSKFGDVVAIWPNRPRRSRRWCSAARSSDALTAPGRRYGLSPPSGRLLDVNYIHPTCCLTSRSYHMRHRLSYPGPR
ncbi:MAG TPA: hypothetical protein VGD37_27220 [Kofleriaceae bacterium]|jgi:hypothetical protein